MAQTIADLGQKVKAKYPGQYDDLSDAEVGQRVKAKYPGAYDDFIGPANDKAAALDFSRPTKSAQNIADIRSTQAAKFPTAAESGTKPGNITEAPTIAGALKDYLKTAGDAYTNFNTGIYNEAVTGVPLTVGKLLGAVPKTVTAADLGMENTTPMQKVGGIVERSAEFMAPGGAMTKLAGAGKLGILGKAGLEAASAYGVSTAHGDSNNAAVRNALISGGLTAAAGAALKGLGSMGKRMELAAVKPLQGALQDVSGAAKGEEGKKLVEDIYKYKLGGSLEQTLQKSEDALNQLETQLQSVLKSQPGSSVDLYSAVNDAAKELEKAGTAAKNASQNQAIQRALLKQIDDIDLLNHLNATQNGAADLVIANQFKRGLGQQGSWLQGFADPDNEAKQIVANAVYKQVRQRIESAAGASGLRVKDLNQQMSDILPITEAVIKRIPVSQRREIISLKEFLGVATGHGAGIGLSIADRMFRSPTAANMFVHGSLASPAIASRLGQSAAGVMSGVAPWRSTPSGGQ